MFVKDWTGRNGSWAPKIQLPKKKKIYIIWELEVAQNLDTCESLKNIRLWDFTIRHTNNAILSSGLTSWRTIILYIKLGVFTRVVISRRLDLFAISSVPSFGRPHLPEFGQIPDPTKHNLSCKNMLVAFILKLPLYLVVTWFVANASLWAYRIKHTASDRETSHPILIVRTDVWQIFTLLIGWGAESLYIWTSKKRGLFSSYCSCCIPGLCNLVQHYVQNGVINAKEENSLCESDWGERSGG